MGALASFKYFGGNPDPGKKFGVGGGEGEYPFATPQGISIDNPSGTFGIAEDLYLDLSIYGGYEKVLPGDSPSVGMLSQSLKRIRIPAVSGLALPQANIFSGKDDNRYTFDQRMQGVQRDDPAKTPLPLILGNDVIRSVEVRPDGSMGGDLRIVAALADVPNTTDQGVIDQVFVPHPKYFNPAEKQAHSLRSTGLPSPGRDDGAITLIDNAFYSREPVAAARVHAATNISGPGDFDNATGPYEDGAYINKADEGNLATGADSYFSDGSFTPEDGKTFSPNRQIASAVAFGSLPTGVKATEAAIRQAKPELARPWQTLLFTANPSSRTGPIDFGATAGLGKHPGFGTARSGSINNPPYRIVPDHLWLDLFTMPVVEPYAISEPFSTAGRVNLNYQIAPFTYIRRTTGLQAVLRSVKIAAIPTSSWDKSGIQRFDTNAAIGDGAGGATLDGTVKGTLYGFQQRFDAGDLFRSASQICDISLVPLTKDASYDTMDTFWNGTGATGGNKRTGDNVREIPYGHIYPRVTTKSNTFTVHMRVQALRKSTRSSANSWKEGIDQVLSEYRGSTTIERYIDAADTALPDFAQKANANENLDQHYRFRTVGVHAFVH